MRRLRVLHVIGGGDTGGAKSHLLPLLSALQRMECEVHLLCLGEGGLADEASRRSLSVVVLNMVHPWDPAVFGPLRRVLWGGPSTLQALRNDERESVATKPGSYSGLAWDVVHTHGMRANLPVRLVLAGRRHRPCLFTTVHSDLQLDYSSAMLSAVYQGLDRLTLPAVDRVICVSDALRDLLIERGYPRERLLTVRSGLELPPEHLSAPEISQSEGAVDVVSGRIVIPGESNAAAGASAVPRRLGTVARLVEVKDIDLLLEVAVVLRRTNPELEVVIVGDGPERDRLNARVQELGLGDCVRFTGRLDDVAPVLAGLDVYLVTSRFEGGVSMAVLEAMIAAVPVVATSAGGVTEVVRDGETGFVVADNQDRSALAAALAERAGALLADPAMCARLGAAGARRVREFFSVERTAATTARAYGRCLAGRGEIL